MGLDFNPTYFSHPMMDGNFSLASAKSDVRKFWIDHGKCCRRIACDAAKQIGKKSVVNYWMPDGYKDIPADTKTPRDRMIASLDEIFSESSKRICDRSIESKVSDGRGELYGGQPEFSSACDSRTSAIVSSGTFLYRGKSAK